MAEKIKYAIKRYIASQLMIDIEPKWPYFIISLILKLTAVAFCNYYVLILWLFTPKQVVDNIKNKFF